MSCDAKKLRRAPLRDIIDAGVRHSFWSTINYTSILHVQPARGLRNHQNLTCFTPGTLSNLSITNCKTPVRKPERLLGSDSYKLEAASKREAEAGYLYARTSP
jgi:hypothetical protein